MTHLRDITMDDLPLYERLLTDPATMSELGGPLPAQVLPQKLRGIVEGVRDGSAWYSVIVPEPEGGGAGTICIWAHDEESEPINEIGWMVDPAFQGRGLATAALRSILDRARAESRWGVIHAFPGVTNAPSNALCRRAGFELLEEREVEYMGRTLRCNHWRLDLSAPTPA